MMITNCWSLPIGLVLSLALSFSVSAQEAGRVDRLETNTFVAPSPEAERLVLDLGDVVSRDEIISTDESGLAEIELLDSARVMVGPESEVTLDDFLIGTSDGGRIALAVGRGLLRFISGDIPSENIEINTPVGVLGIRGTDILVAVADGGATRVSVLEGTISFENEQGASTMLVGGTTGTLFTPEGRVEFSPGIDQRIVEILAPGAGGRADVSGPPPTLSPGTPTPSARPTAPENFTLRGDGRVAPGQAPSLQEGRQGEAPPTEDPDRDQQDQRDPPEQREREQEPEEDQQPEDRNTESEQGTQDRDHGNEGGRDDDNEDRGSQEQDNDDRESERDDGRDRDDDGGGQGSQDRDEERSDPPDSESRR